MSALRLRLTITNDTRHLREVRELVRRGIREGGFPERLQNHVVLAIDEAVTNIIEHAFPDVPSGQGTIEMIQDVDETCYRMEIIDDGMLGFHPDRVGDVDIDEHVAAGHKGGLGIFLMRRLMDVVEYSYERDRRNRLVLVKNAPVQG